MLVGRGMLVVAFLALSSLVTLTLSDDLIRQGFFNDFLPGSLEDERGIPNLPFFTETNRFSDGQSSTHPNTVSSPHFELYSGPVADTSKRYLNYLAYKASAAEQGIGMKGQGDAEKEAAKFLLVSKNGYENLPKPNRTFPVYAARKWNPSEYAIQRGETYSITVHPEPSAGGPVEQTWVDGAVRIDAGGYDSYYDAISNCHIAVGRCRSYLHKKPRLQFANWFSLVCAIGDFYQSVNEFEPGKEHEASFIALDESQLQQTLFLAEKGVTFTSPYDGQLICFANDAHNEYWNNQGSVSVSVVRESWPPSNATIYQAQRIPSCDSAQAIYENYGDFYDGKNHSLECNNLKDEAVGWTQDDIENKGAEYGSGAEDFFFISRYDQ